MQDENEIKPVSLNLNTSVAAAPIAINAKDAINIAREQQNYQENMASLEQNGQLAQHDNPNDHLAQIIEVGSLQEQKINEAQVNQVNDLMKVVEVKTSKKTYLLMILAIIIIFGIVAWEIYHYIIQGG